jgi:ATP-dependent Clp protease protease subunit
MFENQIYLPHPKKRLLFFAGDVEQENIGYRIKKKILEINESDYLIKKLAAIYGFIYVPRPIKLYIDTYGGDIYTTLGLVGVIESSATPVFTYYTGSAMSAGFLILISGHKRFCYKYSSLMYHQISTESVGGEARKQEMDVDENRRIMDIIEDIITSKTKISKRKLTQIYNQKDDWYINPEEALKLEIIDEILLEKEIEEETVEA